LKVLQRVSDDQMNREAAAAKPNSPRAWLMVAAAFLASFVVFGVIYSFGAFLKPMAAEFHTSATAASAFFSITAAVYYSLGALTGRLTGPLRAAYHRRGRRANPRIRPLSYRFGRPYLVWLFGLWHRRWCQRRLLLSADPGDHRRMVRSASQHGAWHRRRRHRVRHDGAPTARRRAHPALRMARDKRHFRPCCRGCAARMRHRSQITTNRRANRTGRAFAQERLSLT
jgi:hypothetical protein